MKDLTMTMKGQAMKARIRFINLLDAGEKIKMQVRTWRNDDFVRKNMLNTHIISEQEHENFLAKLQNDISVRYYIAFYDDEPIGVLNMHIDIDAQKLEFGYYLSNIKYVDSGFGAILEYVLLNHAFYSLELDTVFCRTLSNNKKVVTLHKRFGFDVIKCDEQICYQSVSADRWKVNKEYIESVINKIFPIQDIGSL